MNLQTELTQGVIAMVKEPVPIKVGADAWRVTIDFISHIPERDKLIKHYYIWVTGEYLEDHQSLESNESAAQKFALDYIRRKFTELANNIPVESGVSFSNQFGEEIVKPENYIHPLEQT